MALRSAFFNSVGGDRKYQAGRFAEYFASFIGNGVFPNPSSSLQVMAGEGMAVKVKPGRAWINGYILINDDDYILELNVADGVLDRIDRIVARYDVVDREIRLEVKKGDFASAPVVEELQRDADAYELALADVYVGHGAVSIGQGSITDRRLDGEMCGVVHGTVDQVDVTTLYNQYTQGFEAKKEEFEQAFMAWFDTIQDVLDEEAAGNLLNLINEHKSETASLASLGHVNHAVLGTTLDTTWAGSEAPYSKEQNIQGITVNDTPIIDVIMSGNFETDETRQEAWGYIYRAVTAANKITFYATEKPEVSLPLQIKVVR